MLVYQRVTPHGSMVTFLVPCARTWAHLGWVVWCSWRDWVKKSKSWTEKSRNHQPEWYRIPWINSMKSKGICLNMFKLVATKWSHENMNYFHMWSIRVSAYIYIYMIQPPLVPPHPPPKGGYVTHMQPCIGITICLYWFMYVCLCVCLSVCWYVSMCVSKQGRHVIVFVSAHKDTTCTHNVPAPPPCGWVGGVLPSAAMYRYNYMFLLIYVWYLFVCIDLWFVCMYVYTCPSKVDMSLFLCLHTKILHVHIMFPPPPLWVGWGGLTICSHV